LSTTSSHEDGRPASAPPTLDRGDLSARSRDDRMPATYNHECANHSFSTCRPAIRTYPFSEDT
jgi:hypothetical protein